LAAGAFAGFRAFGLLAALPPPRLRTASRLAALDRARALWKDLRWLSSLFCSLVGPHQRTGGELVKRTCIFLVGVLLAAASGSALASTGSAVPTVRPAFFHTVELRKTKLGKILVNSAGSILYEFTKDGKKKDTCAAISGCLTTWPALQVQGKPSAGAGVHASLLSTIALPEGGSQVTYAGHPLYIYADAPTSTSYAGTHQFGGTWDAVNAKGQAVK
jgi:predicted lipoprotein with Yx(FWY)xxD motif